MLISNSGFCLLNLAVTKYIVFIFIIITYTVLNMKVLLHNITIIIIENYNSYIS